MRTHITLELLGTMWFVAAVLAWGEGLVNVWMVSMTISTFYFIRAAVNFLIRLRRGEKC